MRKPSRTMRSLLDSLRAHMFLSFVVSLAFLAGLLFLYYYQFRHMANDHVRGTFTLLAAEMEQQLRQDLADVEHAAKVAGYSTTVQRALLSPNPPERLRNMNAALEVLSNAKEFNRGILDIQVYVDRHNVLYSGHSYTDVFTRGLASLPPDDPHGFSAPFFSPLLTTGSGAPCFIYYLPVRDILSTGSLQYAAFCAVLCDFNTLITLPSTESFATSGSAIITETEVLLTQGNFPAGAPQAVLKAPLGFSTHALQSVNYLIHSVDIARTGWRFVYLVAENSLIGDLFSARNAFFLALLLGTALVLALVLLILRSISSSIQNTVKSVQALGSGGPDTRVKLPRLHEMRLLAMQINEMVDRLEDAHALAQRTQQKVYDAIIAQQKAEMTAYRSQINPHFLFNTLECVRSMARHYHVEPIEELISATSNLLHYSLYSGIIVPFKQELAHVQNYLRIVSIRFPGRYTLRCDVTEEALAHSILAMILQPLVENCVLHGGNRQKNPTPLTIYVKAWVDQSDRLWVRVIDNGRGMSPQELEQLNRQKHLPDAPQPEKNSIGTQNIYNRLKLISNHCHLNFYAKEGFYTIAEIVVPSQIILAEYLKNAAGPSAADA